MNLGLIVRLELSCHLYQVIFRVHVRDGIKVSVYEIKEELLVHVLDVHRPSHDNHRVRLVFDILYHHLLFQLW